MSATVTRLPLHILFIFIDGIGLGEELADFNPFCQPGLTAFEALARDQRWTSSARRAFEYDHVFSPIDARLSIEGLPQSGTGQASLFTGVNCAKLAGRHFGPYPHSTSKPVIAAGNIFSHVNQLLSSHPAPCAFANAYPPLFFEHATARNRWTVTTLLCLEAGVPIRTEKDLRAGKALTADITGRGWQQKIDPSIEHINEHQAAERLIDISEQHPVTLFEYYLTDKAGHARDYTQASRVLRSLDLFFEGLLHRMDLTQSLLLVTSDHGNLEDLSTKSHTLNAVPFAALGRGASCFKEVKSILDVTPALMETVRKFDSTSGKAD